MSSLARFDGEKWQQDAACGGDLAPMFYPPMRTEKKAVRLVREERAKEVCATCSVRQRCLDYALANDERYGIWGGLTDIERRAVRD